MSIPHNDHSTRILRQYTRRLLEELAQTDSDFNALCMDYFHPIEKRFTAGMDRIQKTNLLFELNNPRDVVSALERFAPERFDETAETILKSMSPPQSGDNTSKADQIIQKLQSSDSHISSKRVSVSFEEIEAHAKQLEKSLPVAAPAGPIDIFTSTPAIPRPPITLYRIPTGVYIARMTRIIHNSCDTNLSNIKPGYKFNVENDISTGSLTIRSVNDYLLGMGAVRYNQGILTATYTIRLRDDTAYLNGIPTETIRHEQFHSTRTIKLHVVGDALLHLDLEDKRTQRVEITSIFKRALPDCVVRFRLEAEHEGSDRR